MTKGRNGYAALLDVHREVARAEQPRIEPCDYATLGGDGSLKVYGFDHPFPPGEYGYLIHDHLPTPLTITTPTVVGEHGAHVHDVVRPAEFDPLALWPAGTVVLVVWTRGRTYPVVVGRVQS